MAIPVMFRQTMMNLLFLSSLGDQSKAPSSILGEPGGERAKDIALLRWPCLKQ